MNILVWSPTTGWDTANFSAHYYLFRTQYKHYGKYFQDTNWLTIGDISAEEAIEQVTEAPAIVFLGIYPWNKNVILDFVKYIGIKYPTTPVFLGGVEINFHDPRPFLEYKNIAGLVKGEGEVPLTQIVDKLHDNQDLYDVPGLYVREGQSFLTPKKEAPRIKFKDGIGPKDGDFFEVKYSYLLENADEILQDIRRNYDENPKKARHTRRYFFWEGTRGCPYGCVYCDWGGGVNTKVRRKPQWMIEQELEFIFKNVEDLYFHLFDANFGIFPQDITTAQHIADLLRKYDRVGKVHISITFAKNNQDNVARIIDILNPVKSPMPWSLDIQSTDQGVLDDIKRTQMPMSFIGEKYKIKENQSKFYTNAMLALPGTTFDKDLKTWCDIFDAGSQLSGYITTIPPQSEMYTPEFIKEWQVKTFVTTYEHATINHLNYRLQNNAEIIHMHSCKSFTTEDYINILIVHELLQLLDGAYITKFARKLANNNGYTAYDFYKPIVDRFLTDDNWLGVDINTIRQSIRDWIFNGKPFGEINGVIFTELLLKKLTVSYFLKNLKNDLLDIVGGMHKLMEPALDVGFRTLPVPKGKTVSINANLAYSKSPSCELVETATENTLTVVAEAFYRDSLLDVANRLALPTIIDNLVSNYRP